MWSMAPAGVLGAGKGLIYVGNMQGEVVKAAGGLGVGGGGIAADQLNGGAADVNEDDLHVVPAASDGKTQRLRIEFLHRRQILGADADVMGCF